MFNLFPQPSFTGARPTRRQVLSMAAMSAGSMAGAIACGEARSQLAATGRGTAKSCIYIFLCGGPSQPDLWDLKPSAPAGVRSEFRPISTSVPGIQFGELIPQVAKHADKLALIRSMTHANNDHNGAIVHTLLGQLPTTAGALYAARDDHPGLGGILWKTLGPSGPLPAWVVLPRYFGTNSPPYKGQSAGMLGAEFDPLLFNKERRGSLTDAPLRLDSLELPPDVASRRLIDRRDLLAELNGIKASTTANLADVRERAFALLTSDSQRHVFDLAREPVRIRERYGTNEYGQSLLMARRLVESGVRFVNVFWTFFDAKGCQFNLWDNHGVANDVCGIDGQLTGRQQLTHRYCTPSFDQSFSALLEDLTDRGMLDETLVAVAGEFGRTPKINATGGRDHWAHCYTQLLAGGGVRGGSVWGASDLEGAYVKDAPVTPDDYAATILYAFGINPEVAIVDQTNRPVRVTSGHPVAGLF